MKPNLIYLDGCWPWRQEDDSPYHLSEDHESGTLCGLSLDRDGKWYWSHVSCLFPLEICPKCLEAARKAGLVREDQ